MEDKRLKNRCAPDRVVFDANVWIKKRIINQAKWMIEHDRFDFSRTACGGMVRELDSGGGNNVLRDCLIGGIRLDEVKAVA